MFFFEKKNQKTFVPFGFGLSGVAQPSLPKFFASFFQKRRPCLKTSPAAARRGLSPPARPSPKKGGEGEESIFLQVNSEEIAGDFARVDEDRALAGLG
jgi:hypothetical protein